VLWTPSSSPSRRCVNTFGMCPPLFLPAPAAAVPPSIVQEEGYCWLACLVEPVRSTVTASPHFSSNFSTLAGHTLPLPVTACLRFSALRLAEARACSLSLRAIQKGTRVLISLWDSLMVRRVPKHAAPFLGTRPNISESHSEISTRVPFCIARTGHQAVMTNFCANCDCGEHTQSGQY